MKFNAADFFEKLEPLVANGISIDQAMSIINKNISNSLIQEIQNKITQGSDLSEILAKNSKIFSPVDIALIRAGENSGKLSEFLKKLIAYRKHQTKIRTKIKKSLFYPSLILSVSLIVSLAMIVFIIPQFQTVFSSFDASLPWITQQVIFLADFIKKYGLFFLLSSILFFITLKKIIADNKTARYFSQKLVQKLPILGKLLEKNHLSLCCYLIATTQQSGIPLLDSIELAKQASPLLYFQTKLALCQNALQQGALFSEALRNQNLIDAENLAVLEVGEASGSLPAMLSLIAERFANSTEAQLDYLNTLIEPVIMLFLALIAGALIVAMYLPIFSMGVAIH